MSKKLEFGKVQTKIMQVLWEKKSATAREITEQLNKDKFDIISVFLSH